MSAKRSTARRQLRFLSLPSLVLLAACGGGEEVDLTSYLPGFAAPAPVASTVLTNGFDPADTVTQQAVNQLLGSQRYRNTQVTLTWLRGTARNPSLNGTLDPMRTSGIAFAHAAQLTGRGELIAIADRRMSPTHEVFASNPAFPSRTVTVDSNGPGNDEHGTSVASVALGNSDEFVGTAPGASLLFGTYTSDDALARLGNLARLRGAVAWNNSWGYDTLGLNTQGFNAAFAGASGAAYFNSLRAYAAQGVAVFAISNNERATNSKILEGLPVLRPELEAGWIAVANGVPRFGQGELQAVTLISSACWEAARWCIVADGSWNAAVGPASGFEFTTGTSFAAPQVSGALALLSEAFPGLSPHELRVRLLASANDDFFTPDDTVQLASGIFKGYSVIYGHGFLDLEAALRPIGGMAMSRSDGSTVRTDAPVLQTGAAFGDAVELSLGSTDVAIRDGLNASFVMPGAALAAAADPASQAGRLLAQSLQTNLAAARAAAPTALAEPFAAFAGPVLALAAPDGTTSAAVLVPGPGSEAAGVTVTRVLADGPTKVELGLKLARDDGGLMSLDSAQSAAMASLALGITQDLGNGAFLALSGELGLTDLGGETLLGATGSARFDAFKLTAGQSDVFTAGDRLSVGIGMPVAIASGETVVNLPVTREGMSVTFEDVTLDLAPQDRQIDLDLTYQTALADGLEMKLSLIHSENFGNRAGVTDTAGALAFAFRF